MGRARHKHLLRFLADHPKCCFCGGDTPATTFDHVPPKSIFSGSRWPEGYRFPACRPCNNSTSAIDQIVGALGRMSRVSDPNDPIASENNAAIREFVRRYPHLALSMKQVPGHAVRKLIRDGVIEREPGKTLQEHPIIRVPPELYKMVQLFGAKLALALILGLIMWRHLVPEDEPDGGAVVRPFGRQPYRSNIAQ